MSFVRKNIRKNRRNQVFTTSGQRIKHRKCVSLSDKDVSKLFGAKIVIKDNTVSYTCKYGHSFINSNDVLNESYFCGKCNNVSVNPENLIIYNYIICRLKEGDTKILCIYDNTQYAHINIIDDQIILMYIAVPHFYNSVERKNILKKLEVYKKLDEIVISSDDNRESIIENASSLVADVKNINAIFPPIDLKQIINYSFEKIIFPKKIITWTPTGGFVDVGISWNIIELKQSRSIKHQGKNIKEKIITLSNNKFKTLNIRISEHSIFTIFEFIFRWIVSNHTFKSLDRNNINSYIKRGNKKIFHVFNLMDYNIYNPNV